MTARLASGALSVAVDPLVGGTIVEVVHRGLGLAVLGTVPWAAVRKPIAGGAARDEPAWLTRYTGGWPLLFPNGGDACTVGGVFHGFHGEASIASWEATRSGGGLRLARRFRAVPAEMVREIAVEDELLIVREHIRALGPVEAMWGHHATFGSDLLAGPVEITSGARRMTADGAYDPRANPLLPGSTGDWPLIGGKTGALDLGRPRAGWASLAYLHELAQGWAAVRRLDDAVGVALSWDPARFPCAWLWFEIGGTPEPPWNGRGNLIGIEPCTTWPGLGLLEAHRRGSSLLRLEPGEEATAELRLHVFQPAGRVVGVGPDGQAACDPQSAGVR